jgi:cytochrome c
MIRHALPLGLLALVGLVACARDDVELAESITAGNVERGKRAFRRFGCGSCHEVHGDRTSQGHAGPALDHFALQSYLPGGLANTPASLTRWIRRPREVSPNTAMPELGVSEQEGRDLAAYLYTLR